MKFKKILGLFTAVFLFCITVIFLLLSEHDLQAASQEEIIFEFDDKSLAGTLVLPEGEGPFPVAIFVHGDGAQDRFSDGTYHIVMNTFLEKGIASFSWDKQGVGQSEGNWLHQNMEMRAEEAIQAMQALRNRDNVDQDAIGFIGFSQGGWVLPEIATQTDDSAFFIIVGGAVNWMDQGNYLTVKRLEGEGFTDEEIDAVLAFGNKADALILSEAPYEEYVAFLENNPVPPGAYAEPMSEDRYHFVTLNAKADAKEGLTQIKAPFLGILGKDDLNVDAAESVKIYNEIFADSGHTDYQITMFPEATHGLLKAEPYNTQNLSEWEITTILSYFVEGKDAYAPGYLDLLADWTMVKTQ